MNNDNVELIPAEKRIKYLSECLSLKDQVIEEKDKQLSMLMGEIEIQHNQIKQLKDIERRAEITIHDQGAEIKRKTLQIDIHKERYKDKSAEQEQTERQLNKCITWEKVFCVLIALLSVYGGVLSFIHLNS